MKSKLLPSSLPTLCISLFLDGLHLTGLWPLLGTKGPEGNSLSTEQKSLPFYELSGGQTCIKEPVCGHQEVSAKGRLFAGLSVSAVMLLLMSQFNWAFFKKKHPVIMKPKWENTVLKAQ